MLVLASDEAEQSSDSGFVVSTGNVATESDPVETRVESPVGGTISIAEGSITGQAPSGLSFLGQQVVIEAPSATAANPLEFTFLLDASLIPEGQDVGSIEVLRNNTLVRDCADDSGTADPDPCVFERKQLSNTGNPEDEGDVVITVLTSAASTWNFAVDPPEPASPVVVAPADQSANEGASENFDLGSFIDRAGAPWQVTVDWGDGSQNTSFEFGSAGDTFPARSPASLGTESHTYADDGTYTVDVTVTETGAPLSDTGSFTVNVDNVKPSISLTGPATADEGEAKSYSFTVTDPGADDTHTITTACGDDGEKVSGSGTYDPTTRQGGFQCRFPDGPNTTNVTVTVTDSDGASDTDNQPVQVTVDNVAPEITAVTADPTTISEGSTSTIKVAATDDAGSNDPLSYSFDCNGDGDFTDTGDKDSQAADNASCSFDDDGSYTVNVRVADGDGGEDTGSTTVTVENAAPTADGQSLTIDEDETKSITLTGSDPGPNDALSFGVTDLPDHGKLYKGDSTAATDEITSASAQNPSVLNGDRITYVPNADYNGSDSLSFKVCDDGSPALCDDATVSITLDALNDAPVVDLNGTGDGTGSSAEFLEATGDPVALASAAEVSDVDDDELVSAKVTLTNPLDGDDESLSVDTTGTSIVASSYDSSTGVLTLTGDASEADYQAVLRTVEYDNTATPPDDTDRVVEFTVNDGDTNSTVATATVTVTPANEPPVVDLNGNGAGIDSTPSFTEGGGPVTLASGATVTDADDQELLSATVTLTNRPDGNAESLSSGSSGPITVTPYNSSTGVLKFSGTNLVNLYETLLRTVSYENTSRNPDTTQRVIEFVVNDGQDNSVVATSTVSLTAINDAPVNTLPDGPLATGVGENLAITPISVEDVDAGNGDIQTTLVVTDPNNANNTNVGTLALNENATGGATVSGNNTDSVTLDGTLDEMEATLSAGVTYSSATGGNFTLTMTTDDRGNTPAPAETGTDSVNITVDAAPEVTTTDPVDNATNFSPGGNIVVDFSEDVDLTTEDENGDPVAPETFFSVNCPDAQNNDDFQSFAVSKSAASAVTINPTDDLPGARNCTVVVEANAISDTDANDPPDNMAQDHTFTFTTAPRAVADDYSDITIIGNVKFDSANRMDANNDPDPFGVLDNDDKNDSTTVTSAGWENNANKTENGGDITVRADGTFEYNPPAGHTGPDRFMYTVNGGSTATVTLNVGGMVWFVNENATTTGDGRLSSPFDSLFAFNNVNNGNGNNPASGDNVFLYETPSENYTGGVTLLANQKLIGQDASQTLAQITGLAPPSGSAALPAPNTSASRVRILNFNTGGHAITLAQGNTIRGLSVEGASGSGIKATGVNSATVGADVQVAGSYVGGAAVDISGGGGNGTAINYNGTISNSAGRTVSVTGRTGGSVTFSGNVVTNGTGILVENNKTGTNTITFSGATKTLNTEGFDAVKLNDNAGATINFTNGGLDIDTTTGTGFSATGGGTVNVGGSNNTINSTGGTAVNMSGVTAGGGFASATSGGGTNNIFLSTVATNGTFDLGSGALSGASGASFRVVSGSGSFTYSGDITKINDASLVNVSSANTGTLTFNTGTLTATNGNGLQFSNADGTYNFNGTTTLSNTVVAASADAGIDVSTGSSGTIRIADGAGGASITNPSGNAVNIQNSNPTVTYGGSINKTNNATSPILVQNNTGGTITFSGATKTLTSTGTNAAVNLSSNGSTAINFTNGGLVVTGQNTAPGFSATGGGTVKVSGTGNTITTATGTALNVSGTTIGAGASGEGGLNFRSISANGAPNGILLNGTGNVGGLTVTGNGESCTLATQACTGGTIQNTTGDGVSLTNTNNPSFSHLQVKDTAGHGISGTTTSGLSLSNSLVRGAGDEDNEAGLFFATVNGTNLTGSSSITNTTVHAPSSVGAFIQNYGGTLNLTISGSTISGTQQNTPGVVAGEALLRMISDRTNAGSATMTVKVTGSTFRNSESSDIQAFAQSSTGSGGGTMNVTVENNTFDGNGDFTGCDGIGEDIGCNSFGIVSQATQAGVIRYTIRNNDIQNHLDSAIAVRSDNDSNVQGTIANNTIGTESSPHSGSYREDGILLISDDNSEHIATVQNNTVHSTRLGGIRASVVDGTNLSPRLDITILNNSTPTPSSTGYVGSIDVSSSINARACARAEGNNARPGGGGAGSIDFLLFRADAAKTATFQIQGLPSPTTDASTYVKGQNPASSNPLYAVASGPDAQFTSGTCRTPAATPTPPTP